MKERVLQRRCGVPTAMSHGRRRRRSTHTHYGLLRPAPSSNASHEYLIVLLAIDEVCTAMVNRSGLSDQTKDFPGSNFLPICAMELCPHQSTYVCLTGSRISRQQRLRFLLVVLHYRWMCLFVALIDAITCCFVSHSSPDEDPDKYPSRRHLLTRHRTGGMT